MSHQKKIEDDLVYKNNELDTFVYRASHDLRGPIASMLGLYGLVEKEIEDPRAMTYFDMYNEQILRLNEVIVALIRCIAEGERASTVAEDLNMSANAVYILIHRAKNAMRGHLTHEGIEPQTLSVFCE